MWFHWVKFAMCVIGAVLVVISGSDMLRRDPHNKPIDDVGMFFVGFALIIMGTEGN